jgi:hypothetical protein
MQVDLVLAVLNILLCGWRAIVTLRKGRLIAIPWILITYFAVFFVPVSLTDEVKWVRGFFAEPAVADHTVIHKAMLFVVAFNAIFAVSEMLCWQLMRRQRDPRLEWTLSLAATERRVLYTVFSAYWLIGGGWYVWTTMHAGYRDYVEGASWAVVFFWASSPLIVISAMRKQWLLASILCLPYLYFAVHLAVRSFALLSLIPMLVVGFYQVVNSASFSRIFWRLVRYSALVGVVLVGLSIYVSQYKNGEIGFPDSRMPFGVVEVMAMADKFHRFVGFDGMVLYGWNYINPFMKLFGVMKPDIADTPNVIADLLEGVPKNWPVYFHYPALLWTDAYMSFAWFGLWMAVMWAVIICAWESLMRRNQLLMALLLPYFCWHSYMLVRGAVAIASVPLAYAFYFSLFPFLIVCRGRLFKSHSASGRIASIPEDELAPAEQLP